MSIEVFFNRPGQPVPIERLYREIRDARHRLTVASAWFTDTHIAEAIIEAPAPDKLVLLNAADLGRGDKRAVTMIKDAAAEGYAAFEEWLDRRSEAESEWIDADEGHTWKDISILHEEWDKSNPLAVNGLWMCVLGSRDFTQGVMHHKFIAIDDRMVWTGSYNFTYNAQRNYENLVRIDEVSIVEAFHNEARACAKSVAVDAMYLDGGGMVICVACDRKFYPDEGMHIGTYGSVFCSNCSKEAIPTVRRNTLRNS